MDFKLKKPCADCPFKKDVNLHLSKARKQEIADGLKLKGTTFACHKTVDYHDEVEDKSQHCAGALLIIENNEIPNQMTQVAERLGLYTPSELTGHDEVFNSFEEFVETNS